MKPAKGTYPLYFDNYIPLVKETDLPLALTNNWLEIKTVISAIPVSKDDFAYAPGKWTIKQVLSHLIDAERIFAYRALRFARKDPQQVLSFEENDYAANAELSKRSVKNLLEEYEAVRKSSMYLFNNLSDSTLLLSGKMASGETSVLALGFIICGHATHHLQVIKERYLKNNS
ncbi:MAG: DinB family protein [bacterium]|nr:DinB family protein [bacterium]